MTKIYKDKLLVIDIFAKLSIFKVLTLVNDIRSLNGIHIWKTF